MKTVIHCPEHYSVRNPQAFAPDTSPEKAPEEKRAELRAIAERATKPRPKEKP